MAKCYKCLESRPVISENGMHYNCCLKEDECLECLLGKVDHYVENPMKKDKAE